MKVTCIKRGGLNADWRESEAVMRPCTLMNRRSKGALWLLRFRGEFFLLDSKGVT